MDMGREVISFVGVAAALVEYMEFNYSIRRFSSTPSRLLAGAGNTGANQGGRQS